MKSLVAFFEIPASDFNRAVTFYESALGLKLSIFESEAEKMAFFPKENGKPSGAISFAPDFRPSKDGVLVSLHVADIEKVLSAVEKNGGKATCKKTKIEAEGMGYFATFIDSEGNRLGIYSDR